MKDCVGPAKQTLNRRPGSSLAALQAGAGGDEADCPDAEAVPQQHYAEASGVDPCSCHPHDYVNKA